MVGGGYPVSCPVGNNGATRARRYRAHGRPRRRPAPQGPDRPGRLGCGRAAGRRAAALRHADGRLPRPPRPRHDPDLHHPRRRGAGSAVGPDELLRVPCDLDLGSRARPRGGRGALRRAGRRRCATRWPAPTPCFDLARAARGPRAVARRGRPADRPRRPPARPPPAARRARGARQADRRDRRVRRAAARRGPAADGHRVRPAGRRARLPAARRPRALPRGLPRARRRARARVGERLAQQEASVERFLELSGDDFPEAG